MTCAVAAVTLPLLFISGNGIKGGNEAPNRPNHPPPRMDFVRGQDLPRTQVPPIRHTKPKTNSNDMNQNRYIAYLATDKPVRRARALRRCAQTRFFHFEFNFSATRAGVSSWRDGSLASGRIACPDAVSGWTQRILRSERSKSKCLA